MSGQWVASNGKRYWIKVRGREVEVHEDGKGIITKQTAKTNAQANGYVLDPRTILTFL